MHIITIIGSAHISRVFRRLHQSPLGSAGLERVP